ncbi:MAG: type 1 glutamine amidotransferase [Gammaproteobacteria bacterium]|nr:MAG: type 1 glutamine amidotransferase [Gammaproteobacteria bacterium]RKZ71296.1 MAG: type 1 glutamine amidotransferase [Gammaproteobacteria bacterium]
MKPILIFRHIACEGPGYLGNYLTSRDIPFQTICLDQGDEVPEDPVAGSGLVFMGGPMSVNDSLPCLQQELKLIRMAQQENIPVLGHCLGGQLISKALGGEITSNPVPEMGWYPVAGYDNAISIDWLKGLPEKFEVFHWHGETFSLPEGAVPLLQSEVCKNQAFILGSNLAFQCHVEMQDNMVQEWFDVYQADVPEPSASVQTRQQMLENLEQRIENSKAVADVFYEKWLSGVIL